MTTMFLAGLLAGTVLALIYVLAFRRAVIEYTRKKCYSVVQREAGNLYAMADKAKSDLMASHARSAAQTYSSAAMLMKEMEIE